MNTILSIFLLFWTTIGNPIFDSGKPEQTVYFFCHSRLIDVSPGERQHVVVTGVYSKTTSDQQVWEMVSEWTDFVENEFEKGRRRTSDLNHYRTLEEAEAHLEQRLVKDLDRNNTFVEKVTFEFDVK
ncbi:hypothetical protein [uncultured Imperialibacter sp.]|uniref:hypothetical protein n=1 Tax=uncultured Imperialibacter sp. TaxID=1672639 RepID=UPI0030DC12AA|tara:strand:- start:7922 stop:8302 length:381 start_codon:yes stop_codon:yes gene_type:complete